MWGGSESTESTESTENVLNIIATIYEKLYPHFENKFKKNGDFFKLYTSHPGTIYHITDNTVVEINPYSLSAKFRIKSFLNHLMNNYIKSLKVNSGGKKTKKSKTKKSKTKKSKKKSKTKKSKTKTIRR